MVLSRFRLVHFVLAFLVAVRCVVCSVSQVGLSRCLILDFALFHVAVSSPSVSDASGIGGELEINDVALQEDHVPTHHSKSTARESSSTQTC